MKATSGNDFAFLPENRVSLSASLVVAAGVAAAWIAAGSSGLLAHSLRHVLTCLVLGAAVVVGWPTQMKQWRNWAIFAGGIAIALVMAVFPLDVVNILAVVLVLSTLAHFHGGLDSRALFLAALAVLCFAVCHFLFGDYPRFWAVGDHFGQALGWLASKMTGQRLSVGATFGGVDFLVLMGFLYGLWIYHTSSPRVQRAIYGGLAIIAAQFAYLAVLSYSEKLAALLGDPIYPVEDDYMHLGAWVWQNAVRTMIPWNLPAVALILQSLVAAMMFRSANWRIDATESRQVQPARNKESQNAITPQAAIFQIVAHFGPATTAILLAIAATLWTIGPVSKGKTVLAYQSSEVNWSKPEYKKVQANGFGLLPEFVAGLGAKFEFTKQLSAEELAKADAVLLLNPDANFSREQQSRLRDYVLRGGSLLVAADKNLAEDSRKKLAELLDPCGIRLSRDAAICRVESWEQSCRAQNHPISIGEDDGRNGFGTDRCASLELQAGVSPLIVGRWGWNVFRADSAGGKKAAYASGERLGDLVLAAESTPGNGKIIVLGDIQCLSNDMLPVSCEFLGRLLGYLTQKTPAVPLWRAWGALLLGLSLLFFTVTMRKASQLAAAAAIFALALVFCRAATLDSQRIVFGAEGKSSLKLAYIDASHLEAYSDKLWHSKPTFKEYRGESWSDQGIAGLARALVREGYLPLRLTVLNPAQLKRGNLLISIAPGRSYSAEERETIRKFVRGGGTFLAVVGAEESRASNPLLEEFNIKVPHSPVLPREKDREPEPWPWTAKPVATFESGDGTDFPVDFYAGWKVEAENVQPEDGCRLLVAPKIKNRERPMVACRQVGHGYVVVIADTYFACNLNLEYATGASENNMRFWSWLLPQITNPEGSDESNAPTDSPANSPSNDIPMPDSGPDEG